MTTILFGVDLNKFVLQAAIISAIGKYFFRDQYDVEKIGVTWGVLFIVNMLTNNIVKNKKEFVYEGFEEDFENVNEEEEIKKHLEKQKKEEKNETEKLLQQKVELLEQKLQQQEREKKYDKSGNAIDSKDDMKYDDYNHGPVIAKNTGNYVDGYSILPPNDWYKSPHPVKMFKGDCDCEVQGVYESQLGVDLLKWKTEITPPVEVSEKFH